MKRQYLKIIYFITFFALNAHASNLCMDFNLDKINDVENPTQIKTIQAARSLLPTDSFGQLKLFFDYSDGNNITDNHAFIDCVQQFPSYYLCQSEVYDMILDLTSVRPYLYLQSLLLTNEDETPMYLRSKTEQNAEIRGIFNKCPNPLAETKVTGE